MNPDPGKRRIFVSCGQQTPQEVSLGQAVEDLVNNTNGFCAYRAANAHNLQGLSESIFEALRRCSGLVAILHSRGTVTQANGKTRVTSSIWINQEVAILAYRRWLEGVEIPERIFKEPTVKLEGAMSSLIANPIDFQSHGDITKEVGLWLSTESFAPGIEVAEFNRLIAQMDNHDWNVIEAVFAGGGSRVSLGQIKAHLQSVKGLPKDQASQAAKSARDKFAGGNNLLLFHRESPGSEFLGINPSWRWDLRRQLENARAESGNQSLLKHAAEISGPSGLSSRKGFARE